MSAVGDGIDAIGGPEDESFGAPLPAPDRLWRHPAERGAEQAAANLAARGVGERRWPPMLMSFIAGGVFVGLAWLLTEAEPAPLVQTVTQEVSAPTTQVALRGPVAWSDWAESVAGPNRSSVVALHLGDGATRPIVNGILYADDGHLIASAHALGDTTEITAALNDGRQMPVEVVATDLVSGVAVLKIPSPELPPPTFSTGRVAAGDRLVGIASSDGEVPVREVVVLAKDQALSLSSGAVLSGLYRLSGELDHTWSGAAVVDENGGIIGLAVTTATGTDAAIPAEDFRYIASQMVAGEQVVYRSWLGIERATPTSSLLEQRDLAGGQLIQRVWDGTPAARAGLVAGDIIVGFGSVNVLDTQDLVEAIAVTEPGETVEIRFSRRVASDGPQSQDLDAAAMTYEIRTTDVELGATAGPR